MKTTLLLALSVLFFSCKDQPKDDYGFTDPGVENEQSLLTYLKKTGLKTDNVYTLSFDSFLPEMKKGITIPDVAIFNKKGEYLPYGNDPRCNGGAFDFIKLLDKDSIYAVDASKNLDGTFNSIIKLNGEKAVIEKDPSVDFYAFIYWGKYAGKLNEDHVKIWEDSALANKKATIKVIKVSLDHQEAWGKENLAKTGH